MAAVDAWPRVVWFEFERNDLGRRRLASFDGIIRLSLLKRIIVAIIVVGVGTCSRGRRLRMIGILVKDGCFDLIASVTGPADLRLVCSKPDGICRLTGRLDNNITALTDGESEDICLVWLDRHKVTNTLLA